MEKAIQATKKDLVACFDAINYQPSFQSSGSSQLPGLGAITGGVCTDWLQSRRCQLLTMRRGTTSWVVVLRRAVADVSMYGHS